LRLFPEGSVTLIRGTSVFAIDAPLITQPGDIIETDAQSAAQLEGVDGTLAALGPNTRLMVDISSSGSQASGSASLSLLAGWIKPVRSSKAPPGVWSVDTTSLHINLRQGSSAIHATDLMTEIFVESGSAEVTLPETQQAPLTLSTELYLERTLGKPHAQSNRPAAAFLDKLPTSFRDQVISLAAHTQLKPITPSQGRPAVYADLADWLACALPVRRSFVTRFQSLARKNPFRTQIRLSLDKLPEWRRIIYPPPPPRSAPRPGSAPDSSEHP
jgi:hypothetical protein